MRQTNVCLNRVFKFGINFTVNLYPGGSRKLQMLAKKVCDEKRKKETNKQRKIKK